MSIITDAPVTRSYLFSDIETNDIFWLSANRGQPYHCMAQFGALNPDGRSRDFDCLNGAWTGTLTEQDEGALELHVHATDTRHFVYICEFVEQEESDDFDEDEIPY